MTRLAQKHGEEGMRAGWLCQSRLPLPPRRHWPRNEGDKQGNYGKSRTLSFLRYTCNANVRIIALIGRWRVLLST